MVPTLIAIGVLAAVIAVGLRASVQRARTVTNRRRTIDALRVLQSVAETGAAVPYAADGIAEVLHLRACRYEPRRAGEGGVAVLATDGGLSGRIRRGDRTGLLLPDVVHLAAGPGRFALTAHPERGSTIEERLVAGSIAMLAASQLEQDRLPRHRTDR